MHNIFLYTPLALTNKL